MGLKVSNSFKILLQLLRWGGGISGNAKTVLILPLFSVGFFWSIIIIRQQSRCRSETGIPQVFVGFLEQH